MTKVWGINAVLQTFDPCSPRPVFDDLLLAKAGEGLKRTKADTGIFKIWSKTVRGLKRFVGQTQPYETASARARM
jgi:hypothetical protein